MPRFSPGALLAPGISLHFAPLWMGIGYLLIAATAYNSLEANPPHWAFIAGDIWLHAVTYFVLAFWFGQLYPGRLRQVIVAIVFIGFGAMLELLQAYITPYRLYELSDLAANTTGAALAWLALRTRVGRLLFLIDTFLASHFLPDR